MKDAVSVGQVTRARRPWRPALFLLVNILGLLAIIWRIEAHRPPASTMALIAHRPAGMVPAEQISEVALEMGVTLDPATVRPDTICLIPRVRGVTTLAGAGRLVFRPSERLRDATGYQVAVNPRLRGAAGELPPTDSVGFSTQPLAVRAVAQAEIERDGSCILEFEFSDPVDPDELVRHLTLTAPDGKSAAFERIGGDPSEQVRIRCLHPKYDRLSVEVARGLRGTEGPLGTPESRRFDIEVSGRLKLLGMSGGYRDGRGRISVRTNASVDIAAARRFVTIEPAVDFVLDDKYGGFGIAGDFRCGERYRVTLKPGLSAGFVQPLETELTRTVWFPDRPKQFRFAAPGGYAAPTGLLKVSIASTNVAGLQLAVERLYASNLVEYVLGHSEGRIGGLGSDVAHRDLKIEGTRNEETTTILDLRELVGGDPRGVWRLRLTSKETSYWRHDSTVVVATDLGGSVRLWPGHAMVWATSLTDARPAAGVRATVYSGRRQPLGSTLTDAEGLAVIDLAESPAGEEPAMVVLERDGDLSYLRFSGTEITHGGACYAGRPFLSSGYEVHAFADRGVYRAGDEARLSGFIRGTGWTTPPEMPLDFVVLKPDGRQLTRRAVPFDGGGRGTAVVAIPTGAPSGVYRAAWRLPGSDADLGAAAFRVADYMPRTLRLKTDCPAGRLPADQPMRVSVAAEHLFGDPAPGLDARCRTRFWPTDFRHPDWRGYRFGDHRRPTPGATNVTEQAGRLDATGHAAFEVRAPSMSAPAAIGAWMEVEVREPGGRALSEQLFRVLDPWAWYVGVRPPKEAPPYGQPATFELAVVAPDGTADPGPRRYSATLYRVSWSSVLRRTGRGRIEYDWTRHEEQVASAEGAFAEGRASLTLTPMHAGQHRLVVQSDGACAGVCDFYVSGPSVAWATEDPRKLVLTLDKESYRPGETARLAVQGPFGGTALVCVESDRVLDSRIVEMAGPECTIDFTVADSWRPNVFLTVTTVRPVRAEEDWRPHRASGAARLRVDSAARRLRLDLEGPDEVRPGAELELAVAVSADGANEAGATVVLAAIDEGVLSLTDFPTPDPWSFFYGDRRLGVRSFDVFGRLAPQLSAWTLGKTAAPGGGATALDAQLARRLNPIDARRVRTAALWAGTLVTDECGVARARFRVPEYVGELRLMAAAASGTRFGSLSRPLRVKSPLMARQSWPRFLAPGDEFDLPVTVFNRTGADGTAALTLTFAGPLQAVAPLPVEVELPDGAERTVHVRLKATGVGKAQARLTARLGEESYSESVELPVRPACSFARRAGSVQVRGGRETRVEIPGGFLPGTARCSLIVGGSPAVELSGSVGYLLEYSYGCVEQTTSRLVPLIYLPELAAQTCPDLVGPQEVEEIMRVGFLRLKMMQAHGGGLAMWAGGGIPYEWGSIYAADILTEARKAGYDVPADLLDPLLAYLQRRMEPWTTDDNTAGPCRAAYAAYVLTRAGKPPYTWMARLEEELAAANLPQTSRFHLAAAMLAAGQAAAARTFIGDARPGCRRRESGGYLDSPVREAAIMLSVLLDADPGSAQVPALAEQLRKSVTLGRWGTTQENAFALMALGKYARRLAADANVRGSVTLPDGSAHPFSARRGFSTTELGPGQTALIQAQGDGVLHAFWSVDGVPADGEQAIEEDSGLAVRRVIRDMQDQPVQRGALIQGELYRVSITVASARRIENVAIVDLLPAGLEIENADLGGSARLHGNGHASNGSMLHVERRDDRLLIFTSIWNRRTTYSYVVRAVTAGEFALPPVEAECMYDPGLYSVHGAGRIEVTRPR